MPLDFIDLKLQEEREKIMSEIYWIFREAIHAGHSQMKILNGKVIPYEKTYEDTDCYVCDVIRKIEEKIGDFFGKSYHTFDKLKHDAQVATDEGGKK